MNNKLRFIKEKLRATITNSKGWRTDRKIIIFESDDWGSIRMPSKQICEALIKKGIKPDDQNHWLLDCLENKDDLENLFSTTAKYKDSFGNFPKFTFNTVMGNPDFEKIKEVNFGTFVHEHFFESYKRYHTQDLRSIWQEGIQDRLDATSISCQGTFECFVMVKGSS